MIKTFETLRRFYQEIDNAGRYLEEIIGKPICISNCGKCCSANTIQSSTIEAMYAVSVLTGTGKLDNVIKLCEGWLLDHHKEAPSFEGMIEGKFIPSKIKDEFESISKLPCPFLGLDLKCMVHEARPLVCRTYGITRTGSGFCPRPPGKGETQSQFMYLQAGELRTAIDAFKRSIGEDHPEWTIYGLFPTLIYRAAKEKEFHRLVSDNRIASAKIIGTQLDTTLMWQPQLDAIKRGLTPDLALTAR